VLKKYCRKFEVVRWPFRKLSSIDKLIETVKSDAKDNPEMASVSGVCLLWLSVLVTFVFILAVFKLVQCPAWCGGTWSAAPPELPHGPQTCNRKWDTFPTHALHYIQSPPPPWAFLSLCWAIVTMYSPWRTNQYQQGVNDGSFYKDLHTYQPLTVAPPIPP
jgi:hypothetical protein